MEKYSVLMSLYQKEKPDYLMTSLDSMIYQSVAPDEIVLVKDGPLTSELENVLKDYKSKYNELFTIVESKENVGLGRALNLGLKHCKNELVARMDTDDISIKDRCEQQLKIFNENKFLDLVGGDITEFIDDEKNIKGKRVVPKTDTEIKNYIKRRCPFNHGTVMFKKSSVMNAGSYMDWFWNEDYYLWIRMLEDGCVFANTGTVLVNFRSGLDMYSRRGGKKYFKSESSLQKYMLDKKIISFPRYLINVTERFIIQVLMPNKLRGFVFRKFARVNNE